MSLSLMPVIFLLFLFIGNPAESRFDLVVEVRPTAGYKLPAGVSITLDRDTGHRLTVVASDQGIARFDGLAPGRYWVTVEAEGYRSSHVEFSSLSSEDNEHLTVDLGPPEFDEPDPVQIVDYRVLQLSPRAIGYWEKAGRAMSENRFEEALQSLDA